MRGHNTLGGNMERPQPPAADSRSDAATSQDADTGKPSCGAMGGATPNGRLAGLRPHNLDFEAISFAIRAAPDHDSAGMGLPVGQANDLRGKEGSKSALCDSHDER